MKTKAIIATLLVAAAASADARFACHSAKSSITGRDRSLGCDKWQCVATDVESELITAKNRREVREKFPRRGTISRVLRARHPESNSRFLKSWSSNA